MNAIKPAYKGLITGLLMIAATLFSYFILKNPIESNFQLLVYGIFTAGIIWSLIAHFNTDKLDYSFKAFFNIGFKTFIVVTLLMAIFTWIYFYYQPAFRDAKIAENSKLIVQQGDHTLQEIKQNEQKLKDIFLPMMVSGAVFRYLIIGALISAVGAGFLSKKKNG
ncbi:MAG: DUF4199 domain-containing protein [Ferruginibacter sp.]